MIKIWNRQNRYVKYLLYIHNLWGNTNRFSNKNIHKLLNINCYYPYHICKIANFNNSKPLSETSWVKNFKRFRINILFYYGKLQLVPLNK